jgi:hypothetical protein
MKIPCYAASTNPTEQAKLHIAVAYIGLPDVLKPLYVACYLCAGGAAMRRVWIAVMISQFRDDTFLRHHHANYGKPSIS